MGKNKPREDFLFVSEELVHIPKRYDWKIPVFTTTAERLKQISTDADAGYFYSNKFTGEDRPNDTWDTQKLYGSGHTIIDILSVRAILGDAESAERLALIALDATKMLTAICEAKPELLQPLAQRGREWPVIKEKRAALSPAEKKLFDAIQLGKCDHLESDGKSAKWIWDDAAMIAYSLLVYIRNARNGVADSMVNSGTFSKLTGRKLLRVPPHRYGALGQYSGSAKRTLKSDFTKASAKVWWNFAKMILENSYPEITK